MYTKKQKLNIFWFRRDLRLQDNCALSNALSSGLPVLSIFIFDEKILSELPKDDARVSFIYQNLKNINKSLHKKSSSLLIKKGKPEDIWEELIETFDINAVFTNEDYEPYAIKRDLQVASLLQKKNISFHSFKDQVIFEKNDILKNDGKPYTVYTPYKNKWRSQFHEALLNEYSTENTGSFLKETFDFPTIESIGFSTLKTKVVDFTIDALDNYEQERNIPSIDKTSYLSPHLRFGTVSIRKIISKIKHNEVFLNELIWREFFMQILYHFPKVVARNFKEKYDFIAWRNNREDFEKWKTGSTGYPFVDAGMRQLNQTGYMHNRVRMIVAGFLTKHLLIDWKWGEAYFAEKLLDYELASNNGNWQWSAGTGCDAAPYFRVFNPTEQVKKFDPELKYIRKWIPEFDSLEYPLPMVEHKFARERALSTYKIGLEKAE
ncbi:cryptochrome/photolyase family protein [Flavicella marina]|uniref:cryptochrome/photolyase family protein n=1 Tax=Flavicella marina TaxID=1475951 RepID=UPI001264E698|nr:deoxyribodipyrimidine photo-lyase [Flavicella marina]